MELLAISDKHPGCAFRGDLRRQCQARTRTPEIDPGGTGPLLRIEHDRGLASGESQTRSQTRDDRQAGPWLGHPAHATARRDSLGLRGPDRSNTRRVASLSLDGRRFLPITVLVASIHRQIQLLKELVSDAQYAVDERAVADAILARALARRAVTGATFRNDMRGPGPQVRSFRPTRKARSFRPCTGVEDELIAPWRRR